MKRTDSFFSSVCRLAVPVTLINPVVGLLIGALCGLSQAAGGIVGKLLGLVVFHRRHWMNRLG